MTYYCVEWDPEEGNKKPISGVFSLDMALHVIVGHEPAGNSR